MFGKHESPGQQEAHKAGSSPCIWSARSRKNCCVSTIPMGEITFSPALQLFCPSKLLALEPSPDFKVQYQQLENLWTTRYRGQAWRSVDHTGNKSDAGLVPPQLRGLDSTAAQWCSTDLCPGWLQGQGAGAVSTFTSQPLTDSLEEMELMESLAQQRPAGCENQG